MITVSLGVCCPRRAGVAQQAVKLIVAFDGTKQITRVELVADAWRFNVEGAEPDSVVSAPRRKSSFSEWAPAPPYQVDIVLRATAAKAATAKLTLRSGYRSVLHFDATALSADLCQPEPEAQAVAALQQSGSLPQCFDDWCKSKRHDPTCARTWARARAGKGCEGEGSLASFFACLLVESWRVVRGAA